MSKFENDSGLYIECSNCGYALEYRGPHTILTTGTGQQAPLYCTRCGSVDWFHVETPPAELEEKMQYYELLEKISELVNKVDKLLERLDDE